jgi:hypothetical protein
MVYQNKIRSNQVEMDVCNKDGFDVSKKKKIEILDVVISKIFGTGKKLWKT